MKTVLAFANKNTAMGGKMPTFTWLNGNQGIFRYGDFNDFDADVPDRAGSTPISRVLRLLKEAGPGPTDDLRTVLGEVPQAQRFTAAWDRNADGTISFDELSALDHLLLSPGLYGRLREVRFVHAHDPLRVSDHFPVVVTLGD